MKNTSLSTLLIVSIVAFSLISCGGGSSSKKSTTPTGGTPPTGGTGGDGGTGDPITYTCTDTSYEPVHDVASLKAIGENAESMAKNYCLAKDIDLSQAGGDSDFPLGWAAVYADITSFTGNFDGEDHTISNLVIDGGSNLGLFSQIKPKVGKSSEIKNLNLNDFRVTGKEYVGALIGSMSGTSTILKVKINNAMINGTEHVGGLIGSTGDGSNQIIDSSVIGGTVTGKGYYFGGMIGSVYGLGGDGSTISNSYATSVVNGDYSVGGLVGRVNEAVTISNSYATGRVTGSGEGVGGLVGQIFLKGKISNSYATGEVTATGTGANKGGLIGELHSCTADGCNVTNSYFNKLGTNSRLNAVGVTTGTATVTGLVGVAGAGDIVKASDGSSNLKSTPATKIFVDWNKDKDIWQIVAGAWPTFLHSK